MSELRLVAGRMSRGSEVGWRVFVLAVTCLVVMSGWACDSSSGGSSPADSAPILSDFSLEPDQGPPGTMVTASVTFSDPDGDIERAFLEVTDPDGFSLSVDEDVTDEIGGETSGSYSITFDTSVLVTKGTYEGTLWVVDSEGNESNRVTATYTLT